MNEDDRVIRIDDDDEKRDPKVFVILGILLIVPGVITVQMEGATGFGAMLLTVGGLVLIYGLIAGAVKAGIQAARHE